MAKLRLLINGLEVSAWDEVSVDSDIETPADAWSLTVFTAQSLPPEIAPLQPVALWVGDEQVLSGVVDRVQVSVSRQGRRITLSGRDLAGQLLDCSAELFAGRQMTMEQIIGQFVLSGPLGDLIHAVGVADQSWLGVKTAVEPGESVWVAVAKAAEASGQYIWMDPDGTLRVGNPFVQPGPVVALGLQSNGSSNAVLSAEYEADGSELFSEIHILGQDNDSGRSFSAKKSNVLKSSRVLKDERKAAYDGAAGQELPFRRLRIAIDGQADSQADAQKLADKTLADANLRAYTLNLEVPDWTMPHGPVWRPGARVRFDSDVLPAVANGEWVVMGRTLRLSRSSGKVTRLKLKRPQDWMNPVAHVDVFKDAAYRARKKAETKAKRRAAAKAARLAKAAQIATKGGT
jgi:prophage tail gpP-like protein